MKRNTAKVRKISIGFNALLCSNGVPLIGFNMFNGMESMLRRSRISIYDDESILDAARKAKEAGAIRFSIVTSGRNTSNPNEFNQILRVLKEIREKIGLEICCSLGLLTYEQALQLKEVGVTRYHSNIETAPSHSLTSAPHIPMRTRCLP